MTPGAYDGWPEYIYDGSHERTITPEQEAELQSMWDAEWGDSDDWVSSSMLGTVLALGFGALVGALVAVQLVRWLTP